jgi:intron-binding protein aquarius
LEYSIAHGRRRESSQAEVLPGVFEDNPSDFGSLFRRILSMSLDDSLSIAVRNHLLAFLLCAFQSLDNGIVRKECAPLVSISIWHHLHDERSREIRFKQHDQLRKAWRAANRRYDAADDALKAKLRFDRSWLFSLILKFASHLYGTNSQDSGEI